MTSTQEAINLGRRLAAVVLDQDDTPPHGIPRERRVRHYFVNPDTDLQVLVNVWPDGSLDAAFETEPGVFDAPVLVRRTESEVVA